MVAKIFGRSRRRRDDFEAMRDAHRGRAEGTKEDEADRDARSVTARRGKECRCGGGGGGSFWLVVVVVADECGKARSGGSTRVVHLLCDGHGVPTMLPHDTHVEHDVQSLNTTIGLVDARRPTSYESDPNLECNFKLKLIGSDFRKQTNGIYDYCILFKTRCRPPRYAR